MCTRNERRCMQLSRLKRENECLQSKVTIRDTYIKVLEDICEEYRSRIRLVNLINTVIYLLILGVMFVYFLNE